MSLNLGVELVAVKQSLKKLKELKLIKKARGRDGKLVREILQLLDMQLNMLDKSSEKVKVAIEARDMTIHHLGEQLMELRSRDDTPLFMDSPTRKKDPGLYRPDMDISEEKSQKLENDMYMQMARLSLGMGGAQTLEMDEKDFEEKIKEVAANLKIQADKECVSRQESLSYDGIDGDESFSDESPLSTPSGNLMNPSMVKDEINDMYMEMARMSLGMGGAQHLGMDEKDFEEKIKEVAANLKMQADQDLEYIPEAPPSPATPVHRRRSPSLPETPLRRQRAPSVPDILPHRFQPRNSPPPRARRATFSL